MDAPYRTPALLPPNDAVLEKDFDAIRARLLELVQSVFPEWSDHSVATFGDILLEMFAFVGDVLGFNIDGALRESRLVTATQRKSVIALARMLGYRLRGAQAATADLELALSEPARAEVRLPAGTAVRTRAITEPVRFQLLEDVLLPAGATSGVATAEHSTTHAVVVDARDLALGDLPLDRTPYLDGSARVSAANGDYAEVDSLLGSRPVDRHFMVLVDQNDRATLRFGDGRTGAPPSGQLRIAYKTGGGGDGNVEPGSITVLERSVLDALGAPVHLTVTNPVRSSGGTPRESVAAAKVNAPASLRALTRCVAREDFEIHARGVPGVSRVLMLTADEDPSIEENSGILFVVPKGGGMPTRELKDRVFRQVTEVYPCTLTFKVRVQDPVFRPVHTDVRVFLAPGALPAVVRERARAALGDRFRLEGQDGAPNARVAFGYHAQLAGGASEVAWSDVFAVVRSVLGIRKIEPYDLKLNGLAADVKLAARELPILGETRLVNAETGALL